MKIKHIDLWVQLHDMQAGFMSKRVATGMGEKETELKPIMKTDKNRTKPNHKLKNQTDYNACGSGFRLKPNRKNPNRTDNLNNIYNYNYIYNL